jgi:hypothetical protein
MTFSRTGNTATRVNSSGLIEGVNANIPRLDYLGSTCPKLLLEPQRTNVILQSQDISSASWIKGSSPTIVTNVAVAPDGTTTADSIQQTDASLVRNINQYLSTSANSTYTFSLFVKKEISKTNFGAITITYSGGTSKKADVSFDEVNGTMLVITGSTLTPIIKVDDYGTYWRFSITVTDNGSNTTVSSIIYPAISTTGTNLTLCAGSARTIWGAQLEVGSFATSYIPTTTASVTRNAEFITRISSSGLIGQTEGVVFFDVNFDSRLLYTNLFVRNAGLTNSIGFVITALVIRIEIINSNIIQASISNSNTSTGRFKMAVAYKENDIAYYLNGSLIGTDTVATIPTCDILDFYYNGTNGIRLNSAALWKTRLTNSELAQLTTL